MQKIKFFTLAIITMLSVNLWSADLKVGDYLIKETFKGGANSTTFSAKTYGTTYSSITWSTGNSGDASSISYASENAGFYNPTSAPANMTTDHVWLNKNTAGYIQINNIPLHNVTKFKAHWASNNADATFYFKYKFNGESSWSDGGSQKAKSADNQGTEITVPSGKTSVSIQFSRENNGKNNRMDDLKLEVLAVASAATPTITTSANSLAFGSIENNTTKSLNTLTVSGSNLTNNITFSITGTNASYFTVTNPASISKGSGTVAATAITVQYAPKATGSHTATLQIISSGATTKEVTLTGTATAPAVKYTVTFNAGSGTCSTPSLTEESAGAGVTLPAASPSSACGTDGWTFAGWAAASQTETTTAPTLYAANSNYKPSSDCTLYAVYSKTESSGGGATFTPGTTTSGSFTISSGEYYASGTGSKINGVVSSSADNYLFTQISGNQYSIKRGDNYITYSSSTNLGTSSSPYSWTISAGTNGDWRLASGTSGRAFIFRAGSTNQFGGYSTSNVSEGGTEYFDVSIGGGSTSTTTYNSNPSCATCSNLINIAKGTPSHGSFILTGAGTDICADAPVTVNLSNITADTHYHATAVTTSAASGGGTPSEISAGSASVTGITASTTINVTFAEDTKVVVTLLNNNNPVNAGGFDAQGKKEYYTGETLGTLPTLTSDDACDLDSNHFMGWTTEQISTKRSKAPDFVDVDTPVNAAMTLRAVWARAQ